MSLKQLTAEKHQQAESTKFMKAVFARTLPHNLWIDWTYQKTLFYNTIEGISGSLGLLRDLPDLRRAFYLYLDFCEMNTDKTVYEYDPVTVDYHNYLLSIAKEPDKVAAHLYTWHMGDLFGGQAIKKIVPGSHRSLEFADKALLINNIRLLVNESMADEANCAFDWAIRMMETYDRRLGQN